MSDGISVQQTRDVLIAAADAIVAAQDRLTHADQAIGDGDHGVNMARGFRAAHEALSTKPVATIADVFKVAGMAMMAKSGGACGAVFGTFLSGAGKGLAQTMLDAPGYAAALDAGLKAVQARGHAERGQKTMIDSLAPAVEAAKAHAGEGLAAAARAAAAAAIHGAEDTRAMVAQHGKAKTLGERSLGSPDPGAISISIILDAVAIWLETVAPQQTGR